MTCIRSTTGLRGLAASGRAAVVAMLLPLLALMPLLHAHPVDALGSEHPVGIHVPTQQLAASGTASEFAAATASVCSHHAPAPQSLPTIVVDDSCPRLTLDAAVWFAPVAAGVARPESDPVGAATVHAGAADRRAVQSAHRGYRAHAPPKAIGRALS